MLPFRAKDAVAEWCSKHGVSQGEAVPLTQVQALAKRWYGPYAEDDWRKWTVQQAQEIFAEIGLTVPFWQLDGEGTY